MEPFKSLEEILAAPDCIVHVLDCATLPHEEFIELPGQLQACFENSQIWAYDSKRRRYEWAQGWKRRAGLRSDVAKLLFEVLIARFLVMGRVDKLDLYQRYCWCDFQDWTEKKLFTCLQQPHHAIISKAVEPHKARKH